MGFFKSATERHQQNLDDEMLYAIVADEVSRNALSTGLYARAMAECDCDEAKARAKYIRLRVEMLRSERAAIIEQANLNFTKKPNKETTPQHKPKKVTPEPESEPILSPDMANLASTLLAPVVLVGWLFAMLGHLPVLPQLLLIPVTFFVVVNLLNRIK